MPYYYFGDPKMRNPNLEDYWYPDEPRGGPRLLKEAFFGGSLGPWNLCLAGLQLPSYLHDFGLWLSRRVRASWPNFCRLSEAISSAEVPHEALTCPRL